ncbi:hypothetical protein C1H46_001961 [Malus baccata]|uniref:Uncharacterized protein n=1 Tax=Malus baccata TaxID=106549 RepID=A0A540NMP6_MALBA|nr:hypothetical protein C1H46_001961 [Malus baccata]
MSSSSTTSVHVTALDGLVNVNSLFSIAVFVGLSLATPGQRSLENRTSCDAGIDVAKKLLVFEVVSFSFFLFSSLVAQGLKLAINLLNSKNVEDAFRGHINLKVLRLGMLGRLPKGEQHPRLPGSDVIIVDNKRPRHGPGRPGQRELTLHHRRLRGAFSGDSRAEEPRKPDILRRRERRGEEAAGVRGCLLQLLPVLIAGGAGTEVGDQPAQQQECRGRVPGPHQSEGVEIRDVGVGFWVGLGLRVSGAVDGECDPDQAGAAVVWQQIRHPCCGGACCFGHVGSFGLYFYCCLCFSSLAAESTFIFI